MDAGRILRGAICMFILLSLCTIGSVQANWPPDDHTDEWRAGLPDDWHFDDMDADRYVKQGVYIGLTATHNSMSGDFDDSRFLVGSSAIYDVPYMSDGAGLGIVLGVRGDKGALEFALQGSSHKTRSSFPQIGSSRAFYGTFDFNCKIDVFAHQRMRPYVLLGMGASWLTLKDGITEDGVSFDKTTYYGGGPQLGLGAAYYFHPQWALTTGLVHRWNWFGEVDDKELDKSLSQRAFGVTIGFAYTF